jgi:hypothetical protein
MYPENPPQPDQPQAEKPSEPAAQPGEDAAPTPEAEAAAPVASVASAASAAPQPRPGLFKRLRHFLFNPETKLGRNMRSSLRAFLYSLIIFAFGMLFLFILVRPQLNELDIARTDLKSNQQQISSLQATLTAGQKQLADLQASYQKSQTDLQKADLRAGVLELLNQIDNASIAVINKDGPAAQRSLTDARTALNALLPPIQAVDPNVATQLDARLTLVTSELVDNPATAQSDLGLLGTTLVNFDNVLAGNQ